MISSNAALITVPPDDAEQRLDRWLQRRFPHVSNGRIHKLIRTGQVRIDGKRAQSLNRLQVGQKIRLPPSLVKDTIAMTNKDIALNPAWEPFLKSRIIYEDNDVIVFNKPAGLAVQGGTGLHQSLDVMMRVLDNSINDAPLRLVHRLDRETSGVLIVARNSQAARHFTEAFRTRNARKTYWAITCGIPGGNNPDSMIGKISKPLRRSGAHSVIDCEAGDEAITIYRVSSIAPPLRQTKEKPIKNTWLAHVIVRPLTGRTHQIRAHLASVGSPIVGDKLYGGITYSEAINTLHDGNDDHVFKNTMLLHARRLALPHPRGWLLDVSAPIEDYFDNILSKIRHRQYL